MTPVLSPAGTHGSGHPCRAHPATHTIPLLQGTGLVPPHSPQDTPRKFGMGAEPRGRGCGPVTVPVGPSVSPRVTRSSGPRGSFVFCCSLFNYCSRSCPLSPHPPSLGWTPQPPQPVLGVPPRPGTPCRGRELWWHPGPWGQGHQGSPRSPRSAPPGAGAGLEMGWEWAVLGWEWAVLGWAGNGLGWAGTGLGHTGWCWAEPHWGHTGLWWVVLGDTGMCWGILGCTG